VLEHEVELAEARLQSPREEAPAARAQRALDQPLAGQREQGIAGREYGEREARRVAREPAPRAGPGDECREPRR